MCHFAGLKFGMLGCRDHWWLITTLALLVGSAHGAQTNAVPAHTSLAAASNVSDQASLNSGILEGLHLDTHHAW